VIRSSSTRWGCEEKNREGVSTQNDEIPGEEEEEEEKEE